MVDKCDRDAVKLRSLLYFDEKFLPFFHSIDCRLNDGYCISYAFYLNLCLYIIVILINMN